MKLKPVLFLMVLVALAAAACAPAPTPAPVPTAVPPTVALQPTVSADPTWDKVTASGKIVFGSSMDYLPFEGYDANLQPTGFDIALAREIGARLGFQVEFLDIPFEGLLPAVQASQVDAGIAAISVTADRQESAAFSNIYFNDKTSALSRLGSGIKIATVNELAAYRIGVQRGTVYEQWVRTNLIDTGLMPLEKLFAYEKPEHAVRDLLQNYVDVVVMGSLPADEYIKAGGVELSGESLNPQTLAIAMSKGSPTLQTKINEALTTIQSDGTLALLASEYLGVTTGSEPLPTPPPSSGTPPPAQICDYMSFVADITVPDGTQVNPGQSFTKTWRIQNTGTCTWDSSYTFAFVQGNSMGGQKQAINGSVAPGQTYDVSVNMTAPTTPGSYGSEWQMVNGQGVPFGTRVWVHIVVPGSTTPATAVPPSIEYFTGPQSATVTGETIILKWAFSAQDVVSAKLNRTNSDGSVTALYGGENVPTPGQYNDLAGPEGSYVYSLSVSTSSGGTQTSTVTVHVSPAAYP
jgi:ABC-type amino acid transport substrate-binding protein